MWTDKQENRFKIFLGIVLCIFFILSARLGYLQLVHGEEYKKISEGNRLRLVPVMAPRGVFYDRNDKPMVSSRTAYTVSIVRMGLDEADLNQTVRNLSDVLGMDINEINKKLAEAKDKGYPLYEPVRIKVDVTNDVLVKIEEHNLELPGVIIEEQPVRDYLNGDFASHVFGYVGEINASELEQMRDQGYSVGDIIGKTGLEKQFDKILRGIDGGQQVEVDAFGRPINILGNKPPVAGDDLYLTIDAKIQKAAEEALDATMLEVQKSFPNAKAAAVVAMDPRSGAILAMASKPSYDPNLFVGGINKEELPIYQQLMTDPNKPMINRAIRGEYPPGSTFKMITALAALEEGKITKDDIINDANGVYWRIAPKKCWKRGGHGPVNLAKAIGYSCNIYFYEVGRRVGIDAISKYAKMFGLGEPTGLELPPGEKSGLLPTREWRAATFNGVPWQQGETLDAAIGQGFHNYTPLQLANYISTLANGGTRYQPYLVRKIMSHDGKLIKKFSPKQVQKINLNPENIEAVKEGMLRVTAPGGTAASYFTNFPIAVAAKTGTAQNPHGADHAWFVAFAPYDDPQIVVAVIVEQGGHGGSAGAPVARAIFEAYFGLETTNPQSYPPSEEEGDEPIRKPTTNKPANTATQHNVNSGNPATNVPAEQNGSTGQSGNTNQGGNQSDLPASPPEENAGNATSNE